MPSSRIMWGADCNHAEGIYGATQFTRMCLAEVLAEKVNRGDLTEKHALRIGRQILRDNAPSRFPQLKKRLWKHKGKLKPPTSKLEMNARGSLGEHFARHLLGFDRGRRGHFGERFPAVVQFHNEVHWNHDSVHGFLPNLKVHSLQTVDKSSRTT